MAEAVELDAERGVLRLDRGERVAYDSLIVACGADDVVLRARRVAARPPCGLKTLDDAVALRERIFARSRRPSARPMTPTRDSEWLTFVVVGGGPTGVEIAGQLAMLARHNLEATSSPASTPARRA